jgi:hypothetical protein
MEVPVTVFLTRQQLGKRLHVAPGTLANWAARGEGPESRIIGGRVLYRLEDIEEWEDEKWGDEKPARLRSPKPEPKRGGSDPAGSQKSA